MKQKNRTQTRFRSQVRTYLVHERHTTSSLTQGALPDAQAGEFPWADVFPLELTQEVVSRMFARRGGDITCTRKQLFAAQVFLERKQFAPHRER
ncbi:hypothetical protein PMI06_006585 [Burkholderia sp. BT03]|nr:hypothetical protein PMI06_006585 [Burkholderia sp. BT03]SKC93987.1 hypothetical protein SAMN06266956_5843 [Paraburkholderia hospita]